jgi:hydrogen peroxide-dependent heme synthase
VGDWVRVFREAAPPPHTREEVPFYTGRRRDLADILASW